ncbi:hypothetical protein BN440_1120 [Erwinia amylovora MR1]|nr:hypothetical protein BN440_1120 [Erwinia amylovora MR1]
MVEIVFFSVREATKIYYIFIIFYYIFIVFLITEIVVSIDH